MCCLLFTLYMRWLLQFGKLCIRHHQEAFCGVHATDHVRCCVVLIVHLFICSVQSRRAVVVRAPFASDHAENVQRFRDWQENTHSGLLVCVFFCVRAVCYGVFSTNRDCNLIFFLFVVCAQGLELRSEHTYFACYLLQEKHKTHPISFWSPVRLAHFVHSFSSHSFFTSCSTLNYCQPLVPVP